MHSEGRKIVGPFNKYLLMDAKYFVDIRLYLAQGHPITCNKVLV